MWIMTTRGFYSAVQHRDEPDLLLIRARAKHDLIALLELAGEADLELDPELRIMEKREADYRWRIILRHEEWEQLLVALASEIEYDNFKSAVGRVNNPRAHTYMRVWSALLEIEAEPAPPKPKRGRTTKISAGRGPGR